MSKNFAASYDVELIRKDFPILSREIYGKPLIYFDNAATAQKPSCVLDTIQNIYSTCYANVHRGNHFLSNEATRLYENARETVKQYLHAHSNTEIIFTSGATQAINAVAYGYGMQFLEEGDEIVLSIMEHHANIVPWHFIRERKGVQLVWLPVDSDGHVSLDSFERLLTPRTRFVAITHMSNVLGSIPPLADIIRCAHDRNIPVLVDGSQAAVHQPVDVCALDCDFYVFTGHKMYGPSGIGVLYGKEAMLEKMLPFHGGGEMIRDVTKDYVLYNDLPYRLEAGTPPIVEAIALASSISYVQALGQENIAAHEASLLYYAQERLSAQKSIRILGQSSNKGPILSFEVKGVHAYDVSLWIDRRGIAIRAGTHCAQPLLNSFGLSSVCRASFGLYNTKEEVDHFSQALEEISHFFGIKS